MAEYYLSCSSTADLSKERFEQRNIRYICFHFELAGRDYLDDLGQSVPPETLYRRMSEGADTKTSQITIGEYEEYFETMLKEVKYVLQMTISSGITGTYNSACIARDELSVKYPERKIYVVDSLAASSGYGLLMETLADMRDSGIELDALHDWVNENRLRLQHWFFSTDLTFYIRGGRISKTSGFIGSVLSICPLLNVDFEGRLIPREKIRTKKKVVERIVEQMEANAQDGTAYAGKCFISQSACMEDAQAVAALIEERFPKLKGNVEIYPIGATIGSHTGPGTVALFFWGNKREN